MIEIVKKTFLAGADFAHKTWDEVETLANEFVKKAKMGDKERSKFLNDLKGRYDDTQHKVQKYMEKVVKDILKKMDIATGAEIKALKKDIRLLKKATSTAGTQKRSRGTTAKKSTTTAAKRRTAATAAKKRTATTAAKKRATATATKKRTTVAAKRRTTAGVKTSASTASAKKRDGSKPKK